MANDSLINTQGKNVMLNRTYTENINLSATQYLAATKFRAGILNSTPLISKTKLDYEIPISNGTVNDDGSNTMTGSSGGDNSTDNVVTFKEGGGASDVTAQNLIANDTSASKIWTIANLAALGTKITATKPFGLWLYIINAAALAKFLVSGTALEIRLGSDASNYYSKTFEFADLAVGWNWITSNAVNVEDLTESGTVSGDIDTFVIVITTNNSTDEFASADIIYDLLRQWAVSDLGKDFSTGYPTFDYVNNEVTLRCYVNVAEANGFLINSLGTYNEDTSPLMTEEDTYEAESKSSSDEFIFIIKDRIL